MSEGITPQQLHARIKQLNNRTSRDLLDDFKAVATNVTCITTTSLNPTVIDNYVKVVDLYLNLVADLKHAGEVKRYTRYPYDKAHQLLADIVFQVDFSSVYLQAIIDPLKDVMALSLINKVPVEFLMVLVYHIFRLMDSVEETINYDVIFTYAPTLNHEKTREELDSVRMGIIDDILTVTDTFIDLRILSIV